MNKNISINSGLLTDLREIIDQGRRQAYISINASMIQTYWNEGRRIVEEEQHGKERAEYGEQIARNVAKELQAEYGSAFNYRNICYFRQFYLCFKDSAIVNSRVHNLTWTHIRHLLRVDDAQAVYERGFLSNVEHSRTGIGDKLKNRSRQRIIKILSCG